MESTRVIRYYQYLTDNLMELYQRGYQPSELRLFLDGFLSALRHSELDLADVNSIEERARSFLYQVQDIAPYLETEPQTY
jgi:hypothetical protein